MKLLKKPLPYTETTIATLGYWLTVLLTRTVIFFSIRHGKTPAIFVRGFHLHHFITGFLLLIVVELLRYRRTTPKIAAALIGVSLALVFDEFLYWVRLRFDYWSMANLVAVIVSGAALVLLDLQARSHEKNTYHRNFSYRSSVGLVVLVVVMGTVVAALFTEQRENPEPVITQTRRMEFAAQHKGSSATEKAVYLTFDADMTPAMKQKLKNGQVAAWYDKQLVAYLEDRHIPATIFLTGMFAETYKDEVAQWAKTENFSFGNHTYDHAAFSGPCYGLPVISDDNQKKQELEKTQAVITEITGQTPKYFRFPGLCHADHDLDIVAQEGLLSEDGNLVSGDAFNKNPDSIVRSVLESAVNNSVVVLHLGGPNAPATTEAVKKLVPALQAKGFGFKKL